jgi:catechol 2,3-dioxygenase-like lactoylglutathione lyase family enzyme
MNLGEFSVSLNITDMDKSLAFYNALGFEQVAGEYEQNWVILAHGGAVIGLFHGMFEENLMTFNPEDARAIQAALIEQGIEIEEKAEPGEGPAHFVVKDPDGNTILIDQHV